MLCGDVQLHFPVPRPSRLARKPHRLQDCPRQGRGQLALTVVTYSSQLEHLQTQVELANACAHSMRCCSVAAVLQTQCNLVPPPAEHTRIGCCSHGTGRCAQFPAIAGIVMGGQLQQQAHLCHRKGHSNSRLTHNFDFHKVLSGQPPSNPQTSTGSASDLAADTRPARANAPWQQFV